MRRLLTATLLLLLLLPAAHAFAGDNPSDLLVDACRDEKVDGTYSQKTYRRALDQLPADSDQYTACRDVINRARLAALNAGAATPAVAAAERGGRRRLGAAAAAAAAPGRRRPTPQAAAARAAAPRSTPPTPPSSRPSRTRTTGAEPVRIGGQLVRRARSARSRATTAGSPRPPRRSSPRSASARSPPAGAVALAPCPRTPRRLSRARCRAAHRASRASAPARCDGRASRDPRRRRARGRGRPAARPARRRSRSGSSARRRRGRGGAAAAAATRACTGGSRSRLFGFCSRYTARRSSGRSIPTTHGSRRTGRSRGSRRSPLGVALVAACAGALGALLGGVSSPPRDRLRLRRAHQGLPRRAEPGRDLRAAARAVRLLELGRADGGAWRCPAACGSARGAPATPCVNALAYPALGLLLVALLLAYSRGVAARARDRLRAVVRRSCRCACAASRSWRPAALGGVVRRPVGVRPGRAEPGPRRRSPSATRPATTSGSSSSRCSSCCSWSGSPSGSRSPSARRAATTRRARRRRRARRASRSCRSASRRRSRRREAASPAAISNGWTHPHRTRTRAARATTRRA